MIFPLTDRNNQNLFSINKNQFLQRIHNYSKEKEKLNQSVQETSKVIL